MARVPPRPPSHDPTSAGRRPWVVGRKGICSWVTGGGCGISPLGVGSGLLSVYNKHFAAAFAHAAAAESVFTASRACAEAAETSGRWDLLDLVWSEWCKTLHDFFHCHQGELKKHCEAWGKAAQKAHQRQSGRSKNVIAGPACCSAWLSCAPRPSLTRACGWKLRGRTGCVTGRCHQTLRMSRCSQPIIFAACKPNMMNGTVTRPVGLCIPRRTTQGPATLPSEAAGDIRLAWD